MNEKRRMIIWSTAAAIMLCIELIVITLTPLAKIGNGTQFGSREMYYNCLLALVIYIIPLVFFCRNIRPMKYVIAVINGVWIISHIFMIPLFGGSILLNPQTNLHIATILSIILASCNLCIEILWYPMCRVRK